MTEVFPSSANSADSYGDALLAAGRRAEAIAAFERGLGMLDADASMGADAKAGWRTQVEEKLARVRKP